MIIITSMTLLGSVFHAWLEEYGVPLTCNHKSKSSLVRLLRLLFFFFFIEGSCRIPTGRKNVLELLHELFFMWFFECLVSHVTVVNLKWKAFWREVLPHSKSFFRVTCRHIILCFRDLLFPKDPLKEHGPTCWPDMSRLFWKRAWRNCCVCICMLLHLRQTCIVAVSFQIFRFFPTRRCCYFCWQFSVLKTTEYFCIIIDVFRPRWLAFTLLIIFLRMLSLRSSNFSRFLFFFFSLSLSLSLWFWRNIFFFFCYIHRETWCHILYSSVRKFRTKLKIRGY